MTGDPVPAVQHQGGRRLLSDGERLAWLRLVRSENVGPAAFHQLLARFGDAEAALERLPELARRGGASRVPRVQTRESAEREVDAARRLGLRFVAFVEEEYPPALRAIPAAPPLLAVRGRGEALARPIVAIVGSRNASAIGRRFAGQLARELGAAGIVVASGLARGIDAAAHEASVATGTVAALAGGLDRIYPPEHEGLLDRIVESGAAISEMPLGWAPRPKDFPRRNRLIAGISLATVVVEAAEKSGSLITARLAAEFGREVLAVPGHPLDPRAAGTNALLRRGATLATGAADVIEAVAPMIGHPLAPLHAQEAGETAAAARRDPDDGDRARVLASLGAAGIEVDGIVRDTGLSPGAVQLVLMELEMAGRIERQAGGRVALV